MLDGNLAIFNGCLNVVRGVAFRVSKKMKVGHSVQVLNPFALKQVFVPRIGDFSDLHLDLGFRNVFVERVLERVVAAIGRNEATSVGHFTKESYRRWSR